MASRRFFGFGDSMIGPRFVSVPKKLVRGNDTRSLLSRVGLPIPHAAFSCFCRRVAEQAHGDNGKLTAFPPP